MPGSVGMETEGDIAVGTRDTDAGTNGTHCNGASASEDGEQSNSSQESSLIPDKRKDSMDGFKIVSRNGHQEDGDQISTNSSPKESNMKNGINSTENDDSMDSSMIENNDEKPMDTTDGKNEEKTEGDEASTKTGDDTVLSTEENSLESTVVEKGDSEVVAVEDSPVKSDKVDNKQVDQAESDKNTEKPAVERADESIKIVDKESDVIEIKSQEETSSEEKSGSTKAASEKQASSLQKGPPPLTIGIEKRVDKQSNKSKPSRVDRVLADDKGTGGANNNGSENLRPFARLLFDLGLDLSRQHVYKDLIKVQKKKQSHNKLGEKEGEQLEKLKEAYDHLVEKNEPFVSDSVKCRKCNYKSDNLNSLELHKEFEHKGACAFCDFVTGNVHAFYFHMEAEHNRQGRVQPVLGQYVCPFCPFENHSAKKTFFRHITKCETAFKLNRNLQPMPSDCDIALKPPPPVNRPAALRPPPPLQKRPEVRPAAPKPTVPTAVPQSASILAGLRPSGNQTHMTGLPPWLNIAENQGPQLVQVGNQYFLVVTQNGQTFMTPMMASSGQTAVPKPGSASSAKVPTTPVTQVPTKPAAPPVDKDKFEICEICGGFVKDRDALRIHFFWAHKIEIHPTVMKGKEAAIKCQQCTMRFWTYQGYRRHTTVTHPTSKPSQRGIVCYVCGNPVPDFITHMTSAHPTVVKNMLGQMRCVVCQDAFPSESALETHMLMDHKDVVTQYGSIGTGSTPSKGGASNAGDNPPSDSASPVPTGIFPHNGTTKAPMKCSRCTFQYTSGSDYQSHFSETHSTEEEPCLLCKEDVIVGLKTIEHIQKEHLKKLTIPIKRMSEAELSTFTAPKKRRHSDEVIVIDLDKSEKSPRKEDSSGKSEKSPRKEDSSENKENVAETGEVSPKKLDVEKESVMDVDKEDSMDCDKSADVSRSPKDKVIEEEIIEVDGEQVLVQKLDDDDDDDE